MTTIQTLVPEAAIDADLDLGVYGIAEKADVRSPDGKESAGAEFLLRLQGAANEVDADTLLGAILQWIEEGNDADDYGVNDLPSSLEDGVSEQADSAVQIYTYRLWQEFTDLCLYEEDLTDLGDVDGSDLTKNVAMRAEYMVASRTIPALVALRAQAILTATLAPYLALGQDEDEALLLLQHDQGEDLHKFVADVPDADTATCTECGDDASGLMHNNTWRNAEPLLDGGE